MPRTWAGRSCWDRGRYFGESRATERETRFAPPHVLSWRLRLASLARAARLVGRRPARVPWLPAGNELADHAQDRRPRIDGSKFVCHPQGTLAVLRLIEHGSHRLAQCFARRLVGREVDADAGPCHARVDVRLVLGAPGRDERNAKAHGLVDTAIAT